jgi:hypothetical protein
LKELSVIRKASAVWYGSGRGGKGELSTDSGVLASTPYSFPTRFDSEKGTNPEELIEAAQDAKQNFLISKVLNAEITLDAKLVLDPQP